MVERSNKVIRNRELVWKDWKWKHGHSTGDTISIRFDFVKKTAEFLCNGVSQGVFAKRRELFVCLFGQWWEFKLFVFSKVLQFRTSKDQFIQLPHATTTEIRSPSFPEPPLRFLCSIQPSSCAFGNVDSHQKYNLCLSNGVVRVRHHPATTVIDRKCLSKELFP